MKILNPKPIFDIFSKKKSSNKKKEKKSKILVDYREKNSLVASELVSQGLEIEFRELKIGDYVVKETIIERKTISDFLNSMLNKRLIKQIQELGQYKNKLLIIEGVDEQELYNDEINVRYPAEAMKRCRRSDFEEGARLLESDKIKNQSRLFNGRVEGKQRMSSPGIHGNAIRGFLLSILLKYKIPIIYSKNPHDTAKFISVLSKKQNKEMSLQGKKKTLNKKEQLQFIIESFPGIGPKKSKKLLEKFSTIQNIILAPLDELQEILGKNADAIREIIERKY